MTPRICASLTALVTVAACVSSIEAPPLSDQAVVAYGDRLYLIDSTRNTSVTRDICTQLARSGTIPATLTASTTVPFNCFVKLRPAAGSNPGELKVDQVELTNELYQLCVDSGACEGPDPSESNKGQLCQNEDQFDECPVVEVNQREASNLCRWVGRRLPSSFELLVARQAGADNSQEPGDIPTFVTGNDEPFDCGDAVLATMACQAAKPRPVITESDEFVGAAPRDVVTGIDGNNVFDLTGNLSEWTADRFQTIRGNADGLPWFCTEALPETNSATTAPACPSGDSCVFGTYDPDGDAPLFTLDEYPVCITESSGRFSGSIGALLGGSWADSKDAVNDPEFIKEIGLYGRRTEAQPESLDDAARARQYGFRCVGDRENGMQDFDDLFELIVE